MGEDTFPGMQGKMMHTVSLRVIKKILYVVGSMGHQHAIHPELPVIHQALVAPSSQKAGCAQQYQMEVAHVTRLALTPQAKLHEEVTHALTVSIAATRPSYPQLFLRPQGLFPPIL